MIPPEIIIAILSLLGTLAGSYMGVRQVNNLVNYRLQEAEKGNGEMKTTLDELVRQGHSHSAEIKHLQQKMDKHNGLVERMAVADRDRETLFKYKDNHETRIQKLEDVK